MVCRSRTRQDAARARTLPRDFSLRSRSALPTGVSEVKNTKQLQREAHVRRLLLPLVTALHVHYQSIPVPRQMQAPLY